MTNKLNWLEVFDKEDLIIFLSELIQHITPSAEYEMGLINPVDELYQSSSFANATIMEWYKSSLVIQDKELLDAYNDVSDEVELSKP